MMLISRVCNSPQIAAQIVVTCGAPWHLGGPASSGRASSWRCPPSCNFNHWAQQFAVIVLARLVYFFCAINGKVPRRRHHLRRHSPVQGQFLQDLGSLIAPLQLVHRAPPFLSVILHITHTLSRRLV
ncbi:hypothetical protein PAXRUDRAFT_752396 [Paxillus rubicundulus Ve08.2h10]|uniref:Uncharacterized protein n=1 Tax=Paxillus rubicundulus Ve08.2h10 TaxID=930991 RepID=A0A0D0DBS0_9AGAM|nr:hypothetical protein PAXRUDRAFT_752396 [Paxillus rubicundulus Ve08.2h10]